MGIDPQYTYWGLLVAAMMYVIGNGLWTNHAVRQRIWLGWLVWFVSAMAFIVLAAAVEAQLDSSGSGIWQRLTAVDAENHWIAAALYALMSVPGATCVLFKQDARWTRLALLVPAIVIFIPAGMQVDSPDADNIAAGIGLAAIVCALILAWQMLLDRTEPA